MPAIPWILSEVNYQTVKSSQYEVAVLPMGATEPHNLHLPYGTDMYEATTVAERICEKAYQQGAKVIQLPTIAYGTETNMYKLPLAMNLNPATLHLIIKDLVESLLQSGIQKVLILNSHGGNDFKPLLRELCGQTPAKLFLCNWYQMVADQYFDIFEEKEDHAGEMETSFGLEFFPDFVATNHDGSLAADDGATAATRFDAVNQGWVAISRPWHLLTTNSGSGNPHAATAEKGRKLLELIERRLVPFLVELSNAEIDEQFPF